MRMLAQNFLLKAYLAWNGLRLELALRLMVKVVLAGNYGNVGTTVLARGVLPLDFLVQAQPSIQPSYPFSIQLELNGMHVGRTRSLRSY